MTFDVRGMTCSACSAHVEKSVRKLEGVKDVSVSLLTNSMEVDFDAAKVTPDDICRAVASGGYSASPRGAEAKAESKAPQDDEAKHALRRLIASVALLVPMMYVSMGHMLGLPLPAVLHYPMVNGLVQLLFATPIMLINHHYYTNGFKSLFHGAPNMNSLISIGSAAGYVYSIARLLGLAAQLSAGAAVEGMVEFYFESAAMIVTLISVGKYLEARAKGRTSEAISRLLDLAPQRATVVRDGAEVEIDASDLKAGDIVIVRDGQTVPTDGVILEGHGALDQSMLTGESLPVELGVGDEVVGATINTSGSFRFRATKVGEDTALSKIVKLVEAAANSKAPISRLADRVSGVFVPVVIGIALVTLAVWLLLGADFADALRHAIAVLVISCPCALGLATPTAIMVGTGKGAELGIMIRTAAALEMAHTIDCVAFDKTGTLTEGKMRVTAVKSLDEGLLPLAAAVESLSSHPIAAAIAAYAREQGAGIGGASDYQTHAGKGVCAVVGGRRVYVGSAEWLDSLGANASRLEDWARAQREGGATVMFAAAEDRLLGGFALADGVRPTAKEAIADLNELGVRSVMLTGDNPQTANAIGRNLGVTDVRASLLPADKERVIAGLQAEGRKVMMVGDGINDAPALTRADLGVAIGQGTDVAIESADVVLVRDDPTLAAGMIRLGRATIRNIRENLFWAFIYNAIGIPVAAGALMPLGIELDPMFAALAMSLSSVCVVTNALRLRRFRLKRSQTASACGASGACPVSIEKPKIQPEEKEEIPMKTVHIEGMMCQHCVSHVKKALEALDPKVEVSLANNCATIAASADDEAIRKAVTEAGYEVTAID